MVSFLLLALSVLVTAHGTPLLALPALKPWMTDDRDAGESCAKIPSWMKSSITDRIVGGQRARTAIPWQVAVYPNMKTLCGGTILDSTTILCAAHCFQGLITKTAIVAGATKSGDPEAQASLTDDVP